MLPSILRTSTFDGSVSVPVVGPLELVVWLILIAFPECPFTWFVLELTEFCFFVSWMFLLLWVDFEVSSVPLLLALKRVAQLTGADWCLRFCALVPACATRFTGKSLPSDVPACAVGFCSVFPSSFEFIVSGLAAGRPLTLLETSCEIPWLDEDGLPLTKAVVLLCVRSWDWSLLGLR